MRESITRRLRRMFHLIMLCFGTALATWGILSWRPDAPMGSDSMVTTALLAIGIALVPISLLEISALEPGRTPPERATDTPEDRTR